MSVDVRSLTGDEVRAAAGELAEVLIDCVAGGGSVGFLPPVASAVAEAFWQARAAEVDAGEAVVLGAVVDGRMVGTVQLQLARQQNQPHRADLAKLLVHSQARRRGLAEALMLAAEGEARRCGRWLLVLDTLAGSDALRLYQRLGWQVTGVIPDFALLPDGTTAGTTVCWKRLDGPARSASTATATLAP